MADHPPEAAAPPRDTRELLEDILENTRSLNSRVARIEGDRENSTTRSRDLSSVVMPPRLALIRARARVRQAIRQGIPLNEDLAALLIATGTEPTLAARVIDEARNSVERSEVGSGGGGGM